MTSVETVGSDVATATPMPSALRRTVWSMSEWARSSPRIVDTAAAGLILFFLTVDVASGGFDVSDRAPSPLTYVLLAGQTLPFIFRRSHPIAVMYVMVGSLSLYWLLEYPAGSDASGLVAVYSAAAWGVKRPTTWIHVAVGVAILTATASVLANDLFVDEEGFSLFVVAAVFVLHSVAAVFGGVIYQRRQWLVDLRARAARAEAAVETTARLAVVEERTRIAREMHDVVAHGISVISVQAAAGREVARSNPDTAVRIFENIEGTGREALTEMRRMLGVLRGEDEQRDGLDPQPTLAAVREAVDHCVAAGLPTELTVDGHERRLAPGLELAAYRIVQEALTNAIKHAGEAASASVSLEYEPNELRIVVTDTGRGAVSSLSATGSGNGIIGMRERVEVYGGEFSAGPKTGGGYAVSARFPLDEDGARPRVRSAEGSVREDAG